MIERVVMDAPSSPASNRETKAFAFQIFHGGRVVAEAPVIVYDLEAALETAGSVVAESPHARREAAEILALLLHVKHGRTFTHTGVLLQLTDQRATAGG